MAIDSKNNLLYVANTSLDLVSVLDLNTEKFVDDIYISRKNEKNELYRHHINDLAFYNDMLFVSMFSFSGMWKHGIYDGGVAMFCPKTKQLLGHAISDLWMPHSVDFINEEMVICDSMRSSVYKTNNKLLTKLRGFIRGITHDGNYYFIAQSEHRYYDRLKDLEYAIDINCGIHMFDEDTKANRFHSFEELGNIHSLVIMDK